MITLSKVFFCAPFEPQRPSVGSASVATAFLRFHAAMNCQINRGSLLAKSDAIVRCDEVDVRVAKLLKFLPHDFQGVLLATLLNLVVLEIAAIGTDAL